MTSEEREIIFLPILPLRPIPIACVSAVGYILKITFLIKSYLLVQAVDLMGFSKITIYHQSFYSIKNFHICRHLYYLHIFSLTHFPLILKKKKVLWLWWADIIIPFQRWENWDSAITVTETRLAFVAFLYLLMMPFFNLPELN